jgi:GrpB-like predicted nucleotidyltransferase (UPF0157 family)
MSVSRGIRHYFVDEPITVVEYDQRWPRLFDQEQWRIRRALGDVVVDVQHFGSTAIPGLAAKPIVDVLVGIRIPELDEGQIAALEGLGYQYLGEAGVPGRFALRKRHPTAFNLAVVKWGERLWRDNLALRDYLRANPEDARRYEQHKRDLVNSGVSSLLEYSQSKEALVEELLRCARNPRR